MRPAFRSRSALGKPEEFAQLAAHIVSNTHLNGEVIRLTAPCGSRRADTMNAYRPHAADAAFILFDVLQAQDTSRSCPRSRTTPIPT